MACKHGVTAILEPDLRRRRGRRRSRLRHVKYLNNITLGSGRP